MILDWVFEILLNLSNFVHFGSQIIISLTNSRKRKPLSELFQRILHKTNSKEDSTYISYLADDMFLNITSFLDIREIYHFGCVDSKILLIIKENLQKLISQKKEWVLKYFPDTICNLMCGSTTLIFAPTLSYKDRFCGIEYIDSIKISDVNSPIMVGIDAYHRPFICIRTCEFYTGSEVLDLKNISLEKVVESGNFVKYNSVVTIFQRFTNNNSVWTHGSIYSPKLIRHIEPRIIDNSILKDELFQKNIQGLIQKKKYIKYKRLYLLNNQNFQVKEIHSLLY